MGAAGGLLATALTLVALLIVSEITLRLYLRTALVYDVEMARYATEVKVASANPRIGHVHRPNVEATLMGVGVKINADGFRDREYPIARGESRRVIVLGYSLTSDGASRRRRPSRSSSKPI